MSDAIFVYGATGYTAGLVISAMVGAGLRPTLSARNPRTLGQVAQRFDLPWRATALDDRNALLAAISGARVVLNLAGPFVDTAEPLVSACVESGAHYLDVSGEVDALRAVSLWHTRARARGVMLMPGVGFDVVPSDCLCAHVAGRLGEARRVCVAISGLELASPGSLKTLTSELGRQTRVWSGGELCEVSPGSLNRRFDFGAGERVCSAVTWGDLITAPITTGAPEVQTYFELTPAVGAVIQANRQFGWAYNLPGARAAMRRMTPLFGGGPSAEQMAARRAAVVVEIEDVSGRRGASRLITPEAYTLTAQTSNSISQRVLGGDFEPGFQTPGRLFGADFILGFDAVTRLDVEVSRGS